MLHFSLRTGAVIWFHCARRGSTALDLKIRLLLRAHSVSKEATRRHFTQRCLKEPAYFIPAILLADSTVLSSNIAIVMGPTPPGTGLIQAAFWLTES